ncbi:hypothetical protein NDU88_000531 [Pleurodeles waltl]|uniref:Uncharacterized protein n=2 Tax=Pleurodeles waltl TaxID=8319 RepID=A0AAV7WJZ3_PLEWA|nr:hypothetical protein NDU88_000531 [Pleurodeles waltl]
MMKPYANWEEFLMPAPISIAILGELAAISSAGGDFSINLNPPKGGFQLMKYPDSFAASLMQVCNSAWFAFNTANKNMDQIRLLSGFIPRANAEIVKILFMPTVTVNALLPKKLNSLLRVSKECTSLAQSVEGSFNETIYLIQEVLEACVNSKKGYENKLTDVKIALEQLTMREASTVKSLQMAEAFKSATETQLNNSINSYKDAMDKLPSVMETVGADILGSILNPPSFTGNKAVKQESEADGPADGNGDKDDVKSYTCTSKVCATSNQVTSLANSLYNVVDSKKETITMKMVYNERDHTITTDYQKKHLLGLQKDINDEGTCKAKKQMDHFLQSGIAICEALQRAATSESLDEKHLKLIAEKIRSLRDISLSIDSYCKKVTDAPPMQIRPPNLSAAASSGGIGSQAAQMAWARVEQARLQLNNTQVMYMKTFENLKKENRILTEILVEMRSHKLDKIDFDTAKNMLIKGLDALSKLKEQWEKMIYFFQMISSLIESCLVKSVNDLVESAQSVQSITGYSADAFVKDMLFMRVSHASNIGYLVNMISSTYYEVSERYLMDRVSALGIFLTMNPSNPEFNLERLKLQTGCKDAQTAIQNLVISKKKEFDMSLEARVEVINCQLGAAIPPMSEAERKSISEAVLAGASAAGNSRNNNLNMDDFF